MSCIGTAGHVDHGKSTLVKALTGIDPDRLMEEKERGMTIDLGFAWLSLPDGHEVSIVDVPGHESFIKNMLAGVGSIDAALLVIAADEGVMPQTREHLAILDLLQVSHGVVALTKADLVDDEWLELVREEVTETLQETTLAGAAILPVSAYTGQGLPQLVDELMRVLSAAPSEQTSSISRLGVDRVFTLSGFGTVVTGTLVDGPLRVGQEVELLPQDLHTRIRTIQTHKQQLEVAQPGSRVALNLPNIARTDITRGTVVTLPGQLRPTLLLDVRLHLLTDAPRALPHNAQVDFYCGAQQIASRVRLLDSDEVQPGKSAWAQLRLSTPAVVARRDRFILRLPSPSATIGGGEILASQPRYHRRFQRTEIEHLQRLLSNSPEELVLALLEKRVPGRLALQHPHSGSNNERSEVTYQPASQTNSVHLRNPKRSSDFAPGTGVKATYGLCCYGMSEIAQQCNLVLDVTKHALESLLTQGKVHRIGDVWFARSIWNALVEDALYLVREYHRIYPLRAGMPKEEWRVRLSLPSRRGNDLFNALYTEGYVQTARVMKDGSEESARGTNLLRLPDFAPDFPPALQKRIDKLLQRFQDQPFAPPGEKEVEAEVGAEALHALLEQGRLVKVGDGLFLPESYEQAVKILVEYMQQNGSMTAAQARDILGTSRKFVLPLLEHMDTRRITQRRGDVRVLVTP